jgi:AraC family transcriptional activator of pobA
MQQGNSHIKRYNFKQGLSMEFEILDLKTLYDNHKNLLTDSHRTDFYHILWFDREIPAHVIDFKPTYIPANTLLFINPNMVQSFSKTGEYEGKAIFFTANFFGHTEQNMQFLHTTILFNDLLEVSKVAATSPQFHLLFQLISEELKNLIDNFQTSILKNLLHSFLLQAERLRRQQNFIEIKRSPDLDYVVRFKALLDKNFKQYRLVSSYAERLQITEKRLHSATSKVLGKPPKAMIDERIVLEAKRLLVHTAESVKSIAYSLGFEEASNFIKYFRKHTHTTPVEFRERFFRDKSTI